MHRIHLWLHLSIMLIIFYYRRVGLPNMLSARKIEGRQSRLGMSLNPGLMIPCRVLKGLMLLVRNPHE